jgi:hypothetical protein
MTAHEISGPWAPAWRCRGVQESLRHLIFEKKNRIEKGNIPINNNNNFKYVRILIIYPEYYGVLIKNILKRVKRKFVSNFSYCPLWKLKPPLDNWLPPSKKIGFPPKKNRGGSSYGFYERCEIF